MSPDHSRGFKTNIKNNEFNTRYIFRHKTYSESSFNIQIGMQIKAFIYQELSLELIFLESNTKNIQKMVYMAKI